MNLATTAPASASWIDYVKLHFIVIIWGFTAILGKWITIPAVEMVLYRTLLAAACLAFLVKRSEWKQTPRFILQLLATGVIVGAHWITFFAAAKVANVSICLVGLSTASLWTAFVEPLFNKRSIKVYEVALGVVIILGLYIILQGDMQGNMILGLLLGVISAMLAALFSTINGKFTHRVAPYTITVIEMLGAALSIIVFLPFYSVYFTDGNGIDMVLKNAAYFENTSFATLVASVGLTTDAVMLFILAVVCTVYAYSVGVELLRRLSVFMTNLTINLEPVYGIILAAIFFHEHEKMQLNFYVGASLILLAVLSYPLLEKWSRKQIKAA